MAVYDARVKQMIYVRYVIIVSQAWVLLLADRRCSVTTVALASGLPSVEGRLKILFQNVIVPKR